ncbi:MAG: glycogen debranching enzyme family protein [Phycisphaerales bacterium]|nr:MAG: glycogen debranching enzyme family protein [Phycisphaerales bacterium]
MLALQRANDVEIASVSMGDESIESILSKEWLLTNDRGSYASSTIVGCNTRRYHGLLVGSVNPPANRVMALANCLEMVILGDKVVNLSTFEFSEKFAPKGFSYMKRFRRDTGVHFDYHVDKTGITKTVYLLRDANTVMLTYDFASVSEPCEFVLRPFVGLRDFHSLQRAYAPLGSKCVADGVLVRHDVPGNCELLLRCPGARFEKDQQWWFNFVYRRDRERGQACSEDLWTPGFFKCHVESRTEIVFWASLVGCNGHEEPIEIDCDTVRRDLRTHQREVITAAKAKDEQYGKLCLAAGQFVARREASGNGEVTVLAGFPWFADWGRDAFIALPGLLLSTGRLEQAKAVLTTFAGAVDEGMIPNRFDDRSEAAHFNSVDASLWFINAAFQYLDATGDTRTFTQRLLPTIRWIIDSYQAGTRYGIVADGDGLIMAGDENTQLTWMDAKHEGVAYTPRHGKAVEVNALWHNALCLLAQFYTGRNVENAERYRTMADKVGASFCKLFWNEQSGHLNDSIKPDGSVDSSLRANQIFAVSLPFSPPLSPEQRSSIVSVVERELLTPYGLRTLNVQHNDYIGTYLGPQEQRDQAYHQGTVWAYLIGPFVEAYLRVNEFSRKSKKQAAEFIRPLLEHLTKEACLGSVSEIFDGDAPHGPRGCIAQAWSVAELLRAYQLVTS